MASDDAVAARLSLRERLAQYENAAAGAESPRPAVASAREASPAVGPGKSVRRLSAAFLTLDNGTAPRPEWSSGDRRTSADSEKRSSTGEAAKPATEVGEVEVQSVASVQALKSA
eukprot:2065295-Prymnesium_polylepis.1